MVSGELRCALTGRPLRPEECYWAPPLITTRQLITTLFETLLTTPGNLGQVLLGEQPNVPYAPEARPQLANQRSAEQVKLLALLLLVAALLIVPIVLLVS
ncbi:MAG: hypothetical protein HGA45_25465 [Chloroflexales bacterium]|nr:hypothetical protein [Chloroflexales bacterium]